MSIVSTPPAARVRSYRTPSGIEIWHVEDYTVPVLSVECAFQGGAAQDPEGQCGLANLLAGLMDEGAGQLDSASFQEQLEERAIELSFDAGRDRIGASLRTLADNAAEAFRLLGLAMQAPRFDQDAIERVRSQIISGLKRDESDPGARARDRLNALAFEGHSYSRSAEGKIDELLTITRDDVIRQHTRLFARERLHIVAVGAVSADALIALVEGAFGPLTAAPQLTPLEAITMKNLGKRDIIDLDIPQSTLYLALPGIGRKDADYMPAMILNHILGGGSFTSRLWFEVREKRGLAYSVWSMLANRNLASLFFAGTATSNERVGESLDIMLREIDRIAKEGASAGELGQAIRFQTGSYALRFDTSRKIAHQLLEIKIEELGMDYIDRRNAEVSAVTLDDLARVGNRLFGNAEPLVVVAGRPTGL
ncbi:MAG TPA: pitrilysin family protein [Rhabdaerophilum sp.]|nr:pitrilysin family protein [Rhabdaerophilum sp.]